MKHALLLLPLLLAGCLSLDKDFPNSNPNGRCANGVRDGVETGVDCGGGDCLPCAVGAGCEATADCDSGVCTANICATSRCNDGVRGGIETDIDCGGECVPCAAGKHCRVDQECALGVCRELTCEQAQELLSADAVKVSYDGVNLASATLTRASLWLHQGGAFVEAGHVDQAVRGLGTANGVLYVGGASGTVEGYVFPTGVTIGPQGVSGYGDGISAASGRVAVGSDARTYVFAKGATGWSEETQLEGVADDVTLDGDSVAVANPANIKVFRRKQTAWTLEATLDFVATRVRLQGDLLIAAGATETRIFHRTESTWGALQSLPIAAKDVAIGGEVAVIVNMGNARVYYRRGDTFVFVTSFAGEAVAWVPPKLVVADPGHHRVLVLGQ